MAAGRASSIALRCCVPTAQARRLIREIVVAAHERGVDEDQRRVDRAVACNRCAIAAMASALTAADRTRGLMCGQSSTGWLIRNSCVVSPWNDQLTAAASDRALDVLAQRGVR